MPVPHPLKTNNHKQQNSKKTASKLILQQSLSDIYNKQNVKPQTELSKLQYELVLENQLQSIGQDELTDLHHQNKVIIFHSVQSQVSYRLLVNTD